MYSARPAPAGPSASSSNIIHPARPNSNTQFLERVNREWPTANHRGKQRRRTAFPDLRICAYVNARNIVFFVENGRIAVLAENRIPKRYQASTQSLHALQDHMM